MMVSNGIGQLAQDIEDDWKRDLAATVVRAMVMGPALKGRLQPETRDARGLRKAIVQKCREMGVAVKPEHPRLVAATEQALGRASDLCLHEAKLAGQCDIVIIVAAGAGALVELGMFADRHCLEGKRVLVLFDRRFKSRKSFINGGPRRAYRRNNAVIRDVDYRHVEDVVGEVELLLQLTYASKVGRRL